MEMRFFIECVKCGVEECLDGAVHVSVKYCKDGVSKWITNSEVTGIPNFYLTDVDIFDTLMSGDFDETFQEDLTENHSIDQFEGIDLAGYYDEIEQAISENQNNPAVDLIEYIVVLARCSEGDVDWLIKEAEGKYADQIRYDREHKDEDPFMLEKEVLFKRRMCGEAFLADQSAFIDKLVKRQMYKDVRLAKNLYPDGYEAWKTEYLNKEFEKQRDKKIVTVSYVIAGMDTYYVTIPKEELEGFKCWISCMGSAVLGDIKEATKEEVLHYLEMNPPSNM